MTCRAYSIELNPTVEQRRKLGRHVAAARRAYNWAFEAWQTWAGARAMCIGFRVLGGFDEAGAKCAAAVACGMAALDWEHGPECPRGAEAALSIACGMAALSTQPLPPRKGKKSKCTRATCDKSVVFGQLYEPSPNKNAIHSLLVRAIHSDPELKWLEEVSSYAIREAVLDLSNGYTRFFRVQKKHKHGDHSECGVRRDGGCALGSPVWRSRKHQSWHSEEANDAKKTPMGVEYGKHGQSARLKIPGMGKDDKGWVKVKSGCRLPPRGARLSAIALSEKAGRWFASLRFDAPLLEGHGATEPRLEGTRIGVETGVREIAVTSVGARFGAVRDLDTLRMADRKVRLWERRKARRARLDAAGRLLGGGRGQSAGWHEAVRELQKYHALAADCRKDLLHKTSRSLVDTRAETIVMRDQAVKRMLGRGARKHEVEKRNKLAPMIQQCGGLYELRRQVEYKQEWAGGQSVIASSGEPTTRRCWHCKAVRETEPSYGEIGASMWKCAACGADNERETNAALNLRDYSPPVQTGGGMAQGWTGPGNDRGNSVGTAEVTEAMGAVAHSKPDSGPECSERPGKRARGMVPREKRGKAGNGRPAPPHPLRGNHVPVLQSAGASERVDVTQKAVGARTASFAAGSSDGSRDETRPEHASQEGCSQTAPQVNESTGPGE